MINLEKGQKISLRKEDSSIKTVHVGCGWDAGDNFDLDVFSFGLNEAGKLPNNSEFVYFNNKANSNGSVNHSGDNLTGDGDGDDEVMLVELDKVPEEITKIVFYVSIFKAIERKQNFGQVQNAYIRLLNSDNDNVVAKFDLTEDYSTSTSILAGELYRHNGEWKFNSIGTGLKEEIDVFVAQYSK